MTNIYIVNDTTRQSLPRHAGSYAVMFVLDDIISEHNIIARNYVATHHYDLNKLKESDVIIINGEGSYHNNSSASFFNDIIKKGIELNKIVILLNTIFETNSLQTVQYFKKLRLFTVREIISYENANKLGLKPKIRLDLCVEYPIGKKIIDCTNKIVIGGTHPRTKFTKLFNNFDNVKLDMWGPHDFGDVVASLIDATAYITAQHHGIYAATMAKTPFIPIPSNTFKIESLIKWSKVPIKMCYNLSDINQSINDINKNKHLYDDFFGFFDNQISCKSDLLDCLYNAKLF